MSGRGAEPQDSDFLSYARMALDTVMLAPPALEGSKELLEILSNFLCGRADESMVVRLDEIGKVSLSRSLPHFFWMDSILGLEKFDPRTSLDGALRDWETKELGITRFPTTVLAVTPQTLTPEKGSALRSMVCSNQLQWEALNVAREFPETIAGKLEDYGALFVTSAAPSKSRVQAKLEIRDRAEALRRRLEKKTGMKLLVGIGATLAPGDQLVESRQQAVLAMNLCASIGRSVVFYADLGEKTPVWQGRGLRSALSQLRKTYLGGSPHERETARAEYVHRVLLYSNEKSESLRAHLLEAFSILVDSLCGCLLQEEELGILADAQEERLLKASSIQEMLSVFHEGLEKIRKVGDKPSEGGRLARMEEVKRYMDRQFTRPLRLGDIADKAGLSKPAFIKNFRQATGQSFSHYLQGLRLEEAKRLLRVSPLSIARVGQESGFNSASYFIQAFNRATGVSPKVYRVKERMKLAK
jgi:AraC-like DNA-binding protein